MIKITPISAADAAVVRLRVEGRVVLHTVAALVKAAETALGEGRPVVLDCAGVSFVDAEGASAIAALGRRGVTPLRCSPFVAALFRAHAERSADEPGDDEARALAARLRRRDPAAFETVVRRYGRRMLATARRLLRDEDDARAAVQEACLTAWQTSATLSDDARLATWLVALVVTAAGGRRTALPDADDDAHTALLPRFDASGSWAEPVAPLALVDCDAAQAAFRRVLDRLPERDRTVLVIRDVERLDGDEGDAWLATTPRRRLHEARQALRTLLAHELAGGGHCPSALPSASISRPNADQSPFRSASSAAR